MICTTQSRMPGQRICSSKDTKKRKGKESKSFKVSYLSLPPPLVRLNHNSSLAHSVASETLRELYAFGARTNWTIGLDRISTSPVHRSKKLIFSSSSSSSSSLQSSEYRNTSGPSSSSSAPSHFHPQHLHPPPPFLHGQHSAASSFMSFPPSHHPYQQPSLPYGPGMTMRYPHQPFDDGSGSYGTPPPPPGPSRYN
jgi:hypothetical protein